MSKCTAFDVGLVGRSSWAFFKTVPKIHKGILSQGLNLCAFIITFITHAPEISRNLQNLFDRSVWEPDGYAGVAKDLFAKGQKNSGIMWNLFVTEVNPCFS